MISPNDFPVGGPERNPAQKPEHNSPPAIDTSNRFFVTIKNTQVLVVAWNRALTPAEALNLAAWLFVMADAANALAGAPPISLETFRKMAEEIQRS